MTVYGDTENNILKSLALLQVFTQFLYHLSPSGMSGRSRDPKSSYGQRP